MRHYFSLFLTLLLAFSLTTCSKEDKESVIEEDLTSLYEARIVGTWEYIRSSNYKITITFFGGGSFKEITEDSSIKYHKSEISGKYYITKDAKGKYLLYEYKDSRFGYVPVEINFSTDYNELRYVYESGGGATYRRVNK